MTSKRTKNHQRFGRMNSLAIPLKKLLKYPDNSIGKIQNLKKILMVTPPKKFFHVVMLLYLLHQSINGFSRCNKRKRYPKKEATA
jgi:hypothetical protein